MLQAAVSSTSKNLKVLMYITFNIVAKIKKNAHSDNPMYF